MNFTNTRFRQLSGQKKERIIAASEIDRARAIRIQGEVARRRLFNIGNGKSDKICGPRIISTENTETCPLRVPLPNANPEIWTEADCAPAFDAIAEQWNEALISPSPSAPLYLPIVLTSSEFFEWIETLGYSPPTFWSRAPEKNDQDKLDDSTVPRIPISKEPPNTKKRAGSGNLDRGIGGVSA